MSGGQHQHRDYPDRPYDIMNYSAGATVQDIPLDIVNPGFREPYQESSQHHPDLRFRHGNGTQGPFPETSFHDGEYAYGRQFSAPLELSALPSRQLAHPPSSGGSIRRKKSHRRPGYMTVRLRQGVDFSEYEAQNIADDLIDAGEEQQQQEAVREMATSLTNKKKIRKQLRSSTKRKEKRPSWFTRVRYAIALSWLHTKQRFNNATYSFELWRSHIKTIESHFGTGVTSYFMFLKWLFVLNWPVFLLTFGFVVIPQILYRYLQQQPAGYIQHLKNVTFQGSEIITGGGWFHYTELYYGYYHNGTISVMAGLQDNQSGTVSDMRTGLQYNMQFAYLFTCAGYYLLCLIIVAYSLTHSYKKNFIEASGEMHFFSVDKVLCGWDYSITVVESARLQQKSIFKELQEHLSALRKEKPEKTLSQLCTLIGLRIFTNVVVLLITGCAGYLLWFISERQLLQTEVPVLSEMALPLTVSAILFILPLAFSIIGQFERFENPNVELFLTMVRTMILKGVALGVLIVFWYRSVPCTVPDADENKCKKCWETFMGEQIYRLVLVDFIFLLGITFFTEFIRRLVGKLCCKKFGDPEFGIARNTLSLIYSQALCWLGAFYSPLLSFITILKFLIVFYVKRVSVMQNCRPSTKPWRGGRAHTFFLAMLFLAYLMTAVAVITAIATIKPSSSCGPYQGLESSYSVIQNLFSGLQGQHKWLKYILDLLTSAGSIAFIVAVLCVVAYYCRVISLGHHEMVALLKHQLTLEGKDKVFLLRMLQEANRKASPNKKALSPSSAAVDMPSSGKGLAKKQMENRKLTPLQKKEDSSADRREMSVHSSPPPDHISYQSYNAGYHDNSLVGKPELSDLQFQQSQELPLDYSNRGYMDRSPTNAVNMPQYGIRRSSRDQNARSSSPEKKHGKKKK